MKAGAHLVKREPVAATTLPPPVEFHTAVVHHIGSTVGDPAPLRAAELDPPWLPVLIGAAAALICAWCFWLGPLVIAGGAQ